MIFFLILGNFYFFQQNTYGHELGYQKSILALTQTMSGFADAAFAGSGQAPGLELWRIEKKEVVKQEKVGDRLTLTTNGATDQKI